LHLLCLHPNIAQLVQLESDEFFRKHIHPNENYKDIDDLIRCLDHIDVDADVVVGLNMSHAVLKETLRIASPAPFLGMLLMMMLIIAMMMTMIIAMMRMIMMMTMMIAMIRIMMN